MPGPTPLITALALTMCSVGAAAPRTVSLAGTDHTGHVSTSNLKNWGNESSILLPSGLPFYPYFFDPAIANGDGAWSSLVAVPLSAAAVYPEESEFTVFNKVVTDVDTILRPNSGYNTRNIGQLEFDDAPLAGMGEETIPAGALTLTINQADFSPLNEPVYNTGSGIGNAGWEYFFEITSVTGDGITFIDNEPVHVDFAADVSIAIGSLGTILPNTFNGTVTISGNTFVFDIDDVQTNPSPLGLLSDVRVVCNRRGRMAAVVLVECPSDVNADGLVNPEDLYALNESLEDLNGDGFVSQLDASCLRTALREGEQIDVLP